MNCVFLLCLKHECKAKESSFKFQYFLKKILRKKVQPYEGQDPSEGKKGEKWAFTILWCNEAGSYRDLIKIKQAGSSWEDKHKGNRLVIVLFIGESSIRIFNLNFYGYTFHYSIRYRDVGSESNWIHVISCYGCTGFFCYVVFLSNEFFILKKLLFSHHYSVVMIVIYLFVFGYATEFEINYCAESQQATNNSVSV